MLKIKEIFKNEKYFSIIIILIASIFVCIPTPMSIPLCFTLAPGSGAVRFPKLLVVYLLLEADTDTGQQRLYCWKFGCCGALLFVCVYPFCCNQFTILSLVFGPNEPSCVIPIDDWNFFVAAPSLHASAYP